METKNIAAPEIRSLSLLYFQRAEVYFELKEYEKCIDDLQKSISLNGTFYPNAYFMLAISLRSTGHYEKSIEAINYAISISEKPLPKYFIERGISYYKLEEYNLAIRDFLEGFKYFIIYPEATRILALSYDKIGDIQGTMKNMIRAAEQGDSIAKDYIINLGNFMNEEYKKLF